MMQGETKLSGRVTFVGWIGLILATLTEVTMRLLVIR